MMKSVSLLLALSFMLPLGLQAQDEDIEISFPGSPAPCERKVGTDRPPSSLFPYSSNEDLMSTFDQLCKMSERIVVVTVAAVATDEIPSSANGYAYADLTLTPRTALLGPEDGEPVHVHMPLHSRDELPKEGAHALAFLSRKTFSPMQDNTFAWGFDRTTALGKPLDGLEVLYGARGLVPVDESESSNLLSVVRGYVSNLRRTPRDADTYFRFLHGLLSSRSSRVRNDAKTDILRLLRSFDADKLASVIEDDSVNPDVAEYALFQKRWKAGQLAVRHREPSPNEIADIRSGLTAADADLKAQSLARLSAFSVWLRQTKPTWIEDVVPLLSSKDTVIRRGAAAILARMGDRRAIPVLIEGLADESLPERTVNLTYLRKLCGTDIQYDPYADVQQRTNAIERLRNQLSIEQ